MAGSGSVPSRKSCMDPVLHTQKGSMFFRLSPPDISYRDFLIANRKKVSLTLSAKWGSSFSLTVIDRFSLKGCRFVCVCVCVCFCVFFVCVFFVGGGGGGLINCPKVLMWSACSESRSFNLSYHTVTVPRFTTVVCCLFSLGEIVSWFS